MPAAKHDMRETANPQQLFTSATAARDSIEAWISRFFTPARCALIFLTIYLPVTMRNALRKQFWNDELFTYYIARLSPSELWGFLATGVDQNPPLFYLLTRAAMALPADVLITTRLPEIVGFAVAGASVIYFLARYVPPLYGLAAAGMLLLTNAYPYAYEARPYGIVAGFAALAVLSWQRTEGPRARWWTVVLAFGLAGAVAMHYYSVLLFGVVAVAELFRSWAARSIRWPIWLVCAIGASPLLACIPLIRAARGYSRHFWAKPSFGSLNSFYGSTFESVAFALTVVLAGGCAFVIAAKAADRGYLRLRVPAAETAIVIAWAALPVPAVLLAVSVTGAYTHRYVLSAVVAVCIAAGWLIAALFGQRVLVAAAVVAFFMAFFVARDGRQVRWPPSDRRPVARFLAMQAPPELPIALADPLMFFELSHQAPPALRSRLFYFPDAQLAIRYAGTDTVDRCIIGMSRIAPLRTEPLNEYMAAGKPFAIYGFPATFGWLVSELRARNVPLSVVSTFGGRLLLLAEPEASAASTRASGESSSSDRR